jgi:Inner membrane protein YgaP-like, transmembrane domain
VTLGSWMFFGIILLYLFAANMIVAPWSYLIALIGLILVVTGVVGTCLIYSMLGMSILGKKT